MSAQVTELKRPLTAAQRKLVDDPDLQLSVSERAAYYARKVRYRVSEEDFFQAGMEAASRAARRFDPMAGASFKTYVFNDIRGGMCALISAATRTERVLDGAADRYLQDVPDDAGPGDTLEEHQARLADFSNGFLDHMFAAVTGEASRSAADGAEELTVERDATGLVREGVSRLPEPQRSLIELVHYENGILKDAVGRPGLPNYIKVRRVYGEALSVLRIFLTERGCTPAT